jgi:hypothetical protein
MSDYTGHAPQYGVLAGAGGGKVDETGDATHINQCKSLSCSVRLRLVARLTV